MAEAVRSGDINVILGGGVDGRPIGFMPGRPRDVRNPRQTHHVQVHHHGFLLRHVPVISHPYGSEGGEKRRSRRMAAVRASGYFRKKYSEKNALPGTCKQHYSEYNSFFRHTPNIKRDKLIVWYPPTRTPTKTREQTMVWYLQELAAISPVAGIRPRPRRWRT